MIHNNLFFCIVTEYLAGLLWTAGYGFWFLTTGCDLNSVYVYVNDVYLY